MSDAVDSPVRAVAYIRVSTGKQVDDGLSLEAQRTKIDLYAKLHDLTLVDVIEDAGRSAKSLKRPGLQKCFSLLESGAVDAILVVKLDRLTRSLRDLWHIVDDRLHGKRLISVYEQVDTQSAAGRLLFSILGAVSQWEREITMERTAAVMQHKKALGEYVGGQPPYGYTVIPAKKRGGHVTRPAVLVENDAEQEVIRIVDDLHEEEWSLREISDHLNEKEFPTRTGKPWSKQAVHRIIKRPRDIRTSAWGTERDDGR